MTKKVLVPIADGVEEIETVTIIDVLRRAKAEVTVASIQDLQITASRGVKIVADKLLKDCQAENYDLVALPGGLPGANHLRDSIELKGILEKQKSANRLFAAICASPAVVFQSHDLLEDKKATSYPSFFDKLKNPADKKAKVVVDGNCITSQAPGTALDFALKLVELLFDQKKAQEVGKAMLAPGFN